MLQSLALGLYRNPLAQAAMRSPVGERIFERAYFFYKGAYEAREARHLREFVDANGWIVDVGANIGFFSILFAGWVERGKVVALEPETENFHRLERIVGARGLRDRVQTRQVAAGDVKGDGHLIINPESHADHRLGDQGMPIALDTLDGIWEGLNRPDIQLIKIDVQGSECGVLNGAKALIDTCEPALYVEIDTAGGHANAHARGLLDLLGSLGYRPHSWRQRWLPRTIEQAFSEAKKRPGGYCDYLFLKSCERAT